MKKGNVLRGISVMVLSVMLMTGCVDAMPDLTVEQSELIAEYAAGLILKYSPRYEYKVARNEQVAAARELMQEETQTAPAEETQPEKETQTEQDATKETETPGDPSPKTEETQQAGETQQPEIVMSSDADLAAVLGIDGVVIRYQSFEICSSYPKDNTGFGVSAAQGKKLLVIHFDIEGLPDKDVDCSLFEYSIKASLRINDTSSASSLSTLIPNDISSFMDVIPAGKTADAVMLAEINDTTQQEIQSLAMRISSKGQSCTVKLK